MPVWMSTRMEQIVPLHTETCNLACTHLLMNPDLIPKTRSVWPGWFGLLYGSKLPTEEGGVNRHFKASLAAHRMVVQKPHNYCWGACASVSSVERLPCNELVIGDIAETWEDLWLSKFASLQASLTRRRQRTALNVILKVKVSDIKNTAKLLKLIERVCSV